jgi:uncharacterized protein involved in type VI secretion and phage assembly
MERINGVVTGREVNLDDPDNLGRIQLTYEWLSTDNRSQWAPIATLLAGQDPSSGSYGSWFMPEIDDIALVSFDHGDFEHPYIIGFLWNQRRQPPNRDINASVRRLLTVSGHVVEFDDNSAQERILIKTQGDHEIELKDTPPAQIKIKTQGGQEVTLNDLPASITIQTTAGNQISISDAPPGITISTQTGSITVNCLQASVTASALLNVTAPITVFSGIVQVPTIIAQAVVGSAYTPAPGNTFGL